MSASPAGHDSSWSLCLLAEVLGAFTIDDPHSLNNVVHRIAEAVDADVCAVVRQPATVEHAVGLVPSEGLLLLQASRTRATGIDLLAGPMEAYWAPLNGDDLLLVARRGIGFDLDERLMLRAMARSLQLNMQVLASLEAERGARATAEDQATHDSLTGLDNRLSSTQQLTEWIDSAVAKELSGRLAVLFIDLDRFKHVNDAHGHATGDQFLITVARVLQQQVEEGDLVARMAGDEFLVARRHTDREGAEALAASIIEAISMPMTLGGKLLCHSASIGIAFDTPKDDAESLIENADLAMYEAKESGRSRIACYNQDLRRRAQQRSLLETELRRGLTAGDLMVYYQPILTLPDLRLRGFEALVRWHHPSQGLLLPNVFMSIAEDSGLVVELDHYVLDKALDQLATWNRIFRGQPLHLSVNVSGRSFIDRKLPERVKRSLAAKNISASQLLLEITETVLIEDLEAATASMKQLENEGLRLAIDDFGTGYSSLRYLKRFPVEVLKIDKSFVDGVDNNYEDQAIIKAVVEMARALDITVVAEGVENEEQEKLLKLLDCDAVQGFRYGKPMDTAMATAYVEMNNVGLAKKPA